MITAARFPSSAAAELAGAGGALRQVAVKAGTVLHLSPGAWHSAAFTADTVRLEWNLAPG